MNDTTRGMFNAAAFAKMKPTAVFVNTAREPLVVEADLAAALLEGEPLWAWVNPEVATNRRKVADLGDQSS